MDSANHISTQKKARFHSSINYHKITAMKKRDVYVVLRADNCTDSHDDFAVFSTLDGQSSTDKRRLKSKITKKRL